MKYKAYLVEENDGVYKGSIKEIDMPAVKPGNVIIKVHYSSLNYKDALAASGVKGVASTYPFVPVNTKGFDDRSTSLIWSLIISTPNC